MAVEYPAECGVCGLELLDPMSAGAHVVQHIVRRGTMAATPDSESDVQGGDRG